MKIFRLWLAAAAVTAITVQPAAAQDAQIIHVGDAALTCTQIASEAARLTEALGGAPEGVFGTEQMIGAATAAATQTALLSGAGQALPGLGLIGNALGGMARRDRERREAAALVARQRWYYLNGLYTGRECDRVQAEAAATTVADAALAATAEPTTTAPPAAGQ